MTTRVCSNIGHFDPLPPISVRNSKYVKNLTILGHDWLPLHISMNLIIKYCPVIMLVVQIGSHLEVTTLVNLCTRD